MNPPASSAVAGAPRVVVLATGGTIAGQAADPARPLHYASSVLGVDALVRGVPGVHDVPLETEQVAQLDSKDMDEATWRRLHLACERHLSRPEVAGLVITHGTDTLEETAFFLQRTLAPMKPVVLTAAMRPANALDADGPGNLRDAITVARSGAAGVVVVMAGAVHAPEQLRKHHGQAVDAFVSVGEGPLGRVDPDGVHWVRAPRVSAVPPGITAHLARPHWPPVEIVVSHAGASGAIVRAVVQAGVRGLVVAATGNGTVHAALGVALTEAAESGVLVWRASRCEAGGIVDDGPSPWPHAGGLSPVQARIALQLALLSGFAAPSDTSVAALAPQ